MDHKRLPDTPWHIGYVKKDENDPRRHKARCVYNDGDKCKNPYMLRCVSSSHCKYYAEDWETAERFKASMKIDYKGAGVIPTSIGEILYGKTDKGQNKLLFSRPNEYEKCPYCKNVIRKKQLQKHIEQKCTKKRADDSQGNSEIKNKALKVKSAEQTMSVSKKSICLSCKNYDRDLGSCRLFTPIQKVILKCLFYKP